MRAVLTEEKEGKLRTGELTFMDRAFSNEMDFLIEASLNDYNVSGVVLLDIYRVQFGYNCSV